MTLPLFSARVLKQFGRKFKVEHQNTGVRLVVRVPLLGDASIVPPFIPTSVLNILQGNEDVSATQNFVQKILSEGGTKSYVVPVNTLIAPRGSFDSTFLRMDNTHQGPPSLTQPEMLRTGRFHIPRYLQSDGMDALCLKVKASSLQLRDFTSRRMLQSFSTQPGISINHSIGIANKTSKQKHTHPLNSKNLLKFSKNGNLFQLQKLLPEALGCRNTNILTSLRAPGSGASCLHFAAGGQPCEKSSEDEFLGCVNELLSFGADPNARAFNGSTPLHWAAGSGNARAVEAIIKGGGDPTLISWTWAASVFGHASGQTALHWAAESGCKETVDIITNMCAHAGGEVDDRGRSPADLTLAKGNTAVPFSSMIDRENMKKLLRKREEEEWVIIEVIAQRSQESHTGHNMSL